MNGRTLLIVIGAIVVIGGIILIVAQSNAPIENLANRSATTPTTNAGDPNATGATPTASDIPNLTLQSFAGASVHLPDFIGTPLVLNTWASWCPFCVQELPDFATVQAELGDTVRIVAINRKESERTARGYLEGLNVTNDLVYLFDPADDFYQAVGGFSMPETLFLNAAGELVFHARGPLSLEQIRARAAELQS